MTPLAGQTRALKKGNQLFACRFLFLLRCLLKFADAPQVVSPQLETDCLDFRTAQLARSSASTVPAVSDICWSSIWTAAVGV
jgi:hypothetical protein